MEEVKTKKTIGEQLTELIRSIKGNRVVAGFVLTAIVSVIGFAWKNADPPFVKAQIETIQTTIAQHIANEDAKDKSRDVDVEVLKTKVSTTSQQVIDIGKKQDSDHDILIEIKTILNKVNNNTKK